MAEGRPNRIGRYAVLAELGQGAMGVVYKAHDPQIDRVVAIKTLRRDLGLPTDEYADLRKRFYQEAMAAGRLSHPNIVMVHDVVEIEDVPYIVMQFVDGRTLGDVIAAEGPLAPERAVRVLAQVCEALEYAHGRGVVHRDIKPANILVTPDGVARLGDFGIARLGGSGVTRTGVLVGTPAYMSPEQLEGRPPDGRSDLFSLGVVLYEALTGVNPFQADELTTTLYRVVQVEPAPVRERNPRVSPALARVTARALAKQADRRYQSARALARALTEALERPGAAPAPPVRTTRRRAPRRVALVGVAALVIAGVGWGVVGRDGAQETPRVGEIAVSTNRSVEVLVDGTSRGLTEDAPLVIRDVAIGERVVTLRLGSREQEFREVVRDGETLRVSYRFPESTDAPLNQLLKATGTKLLDTAKEKLRDVPVLGDLTRDRTAPGRRPDGQKGEKR